MTYLVLLIFGLAFGSFINAFVWRYHENKDWIRGRSECVSCGHRLSVIDLVPIFSWIALKGKCRYCRKRISIQYPLIELTLPILFVLSYYYWPIRLVGILQPIIFILWLAVITGLTVLAIYDIRWMKLPTKIIYFLLAIELVSVIIQISDKPRFATALNFLLASAVGGGLFYILYLVSRGRWIGGGDVRLGFLLGLIVSSVAKSFLLIFLASLLGTLFAAVLLAIGKLSRKHIIPFGPFLILSTIIVQLAGSDILNWYKTTFLR